MVTVLHVVHGYRDLVRGMSVEYCESFICEMLSLHSGVYGLLCLLACYFLSTNIVSHVSKSDFTLM